MSHAQPVYDISNHSVSDINADTMHYVH